MIAFLHHQNQAPLKNAGTEITNNAINNSEVLCINCLKPKIKHRHAETVKLKQVYCFCIACHARQFHL